MKVLIIGGSSGLGLGVAKWFAGHGDSVIVTGRTAPEEKALDFRKFDLTQKDLPSAVSRFVDKLPRIDCLVYAAGFYQEGLITDLTEEDIENMLDVCGRGMIYLVRAIMAKQNELEQLIVVTSSTQYKPQRLEPVYSFTKAGQGHFANSISEDGRVKRVLVISPSGTKTPFWRGKKHPDYDNFLDPEWVTDKIVEAQEGQYRYKFVKIYRMPARVEVVEHR